MLLPASELHYFFFLFECRIWLVLVGLGSGGFSLFGFLRTLSHGFRSPAGDITLPAPGVSSLRLEQDGCCALLVRLCRVRRTAQKSSR